MKLAPELRLLDSYISISSKPMRIAIYARKSTESEERQIQSLEDQLRILHGIADQHGHTIVEVVSESKSAKEPGKRPGFQSLLALIEEGQIEGILTWHINRLTRNLVDGGLLAHLLSSGKLQMIRTPERTFRSEDNVLLLAIENGVATSYIHDLSKAVRRGMDSKAAKGWIPGKPPIGYRNNPETREIDLDTVRAPLVRRAFDMLASGSHSVAEITRELESLGLTGRGKRRGGRAFTNAAIHKMLVNPFYCGLLRYKGTTITGAHQPILTQGEFQLAQDRLKRQAQPKHRRDEPAAFAGVFTCAVCGAAVVFESQTKRLESTGDMVAYSYYHCSGSRGCKRLSVREQPISELSRVFVDSLRISKSFADWCYEAVINGSSLDQGESEASIEEARAVLGADMKRLDSLTMKYIDGDVERDTYQRMQQELNQSIEKRRRIIRRLENRESMLLTHIQEKLKAGVQANQYIGGDQNLRRGVLNSLGGPHVFRGNHVEFRADPVLQKIASFEPGNGSSQSAKSDDFVPDDQLWWTLGDSNS